MPETGDGAPIHDREPNSARMYDYLLGGAANFGPDREAADRAVAAFPNFKVGVRVNRAYLGRAVAWLTRHGIDQFLDLGSGIPTVGNVHEIAHRINPAAKVAYVDYESVAATHARTLLRGIPQVSITQADIRDPANVLAAPQVADLLDFSRPVAVLAVAILHFIPDADDPWGMLATYRDACVPGSALAISHGSKVTLTDTQIEEFLAAYAKTSTPAVFRTPEQIRAFLTGYQLIDPGLVLLPQWRAPQPVSDGEAAEANIYGAVGLLAD